jgi:hypothetical protein
MLTLDRRIEYKHVEFFHENVPAGLSGYKVAFVSDTHDMSKTQLRAMAAELDAQEIDLLLLGGDYITRWNPSDYPMDILSETGATDGVYGVDGNHDDTELLAASMQEHGIRLLSNEGVHVREGFYLAGLEDYWTRRADTEKALSGANPGDFVLMFAHNPDVTMARDTSRAHLILCGHTHGGQISLFGAWAPWLTFASKYGHHFKTGWSESRDGVPVYVSNGAGTYRGIPRVYARPQVIIVTLYSEGIADGQ